MKTFSLIFPKPQDKKIYLGRTVNLQEKEVYILKQRY